jgi:hypothetical protein
LSALLLQGSAEHSLEAAVALPPSTEIYIGQVPAYVKKKMPFLFRDDTELLGVTAERAGYIEAEPGRVKRPSTKTILPTHCPNGAGALRWFVTVSL